jgi:hypothetical protein
VRILAILDINTISTASVLKMFRAALYFCIGINLRIGPFLYIGYKIKMKKWLTHGFLAICKVTVNFNPGFQLIFHYNLRHLRKPNKIVVCALTYRDPCILASVEHRRTADLRVYDRKKSCCFPVRSHKMSGQKKEISTSSEDGGQAHRIRGQTQRG